MANTASTSRISVGTGLPFFLCVVCLLPDIPKVTLFPARLPPPAARAYTYYRPLSTVFQTRLQIFPFFHEYFYNFETALLPVKKGAGPPKTGSPAPLADGPYQRFITCWYMSM